MFYLDSNVFIFAAVDSGLKAQRARSILEGMATGKNEAMTSSLTVDEVAWKLLRLVSREVAIQESRRIMDLPGLKILPVDQADVRMALSLMEKYGRIKPRDAIHSAVCINSGVFTIVSDDSDFDTVKEINRMPLT